MTNVRVSRNDTQSYLYGSDTLFSHMLKDMGLWYSPELNALVVVNAVRGFRTILLGTSTGWESYDVHQDDPGEGILAKVLAEFNKNNPTSEPSPGETWSIRPHIYGGWVDAKVVELHGRKVFVYEDPVTDELEVCAVEVVLHEDRRKHNRIDTRR